MVQGEVDPITCHKSKECLETLDGGKDGQRYVPAALPPGMTRCTLYRRQGEPQGRSGRVRNISLPPGFDRRTVQPVARRYTHSAIPTTAATAATAAAELGRAPRRHLHLDRFRSLIQPSALNDSSSWCSEAVTNPSTNLLTTKYRPALRPTQPPIQVPVIMGVKWPDREAGGSHHPQRTVQNAKDSPYLRMAQCIIRHRDDSGLSSGSGLGSGSEYHIHRQTPFYVPKSAVLKMCAADPKGSVDKFL